LVGVCHLVKNKFKYHDTTDCVVVSLPSRCRESAETNHGIQTADAVRYQKDIIE